MNTSALIFNFLKGRDQVTPHLRRIAMSALNASRRLRFVGQMTGVIWLAAAGAIGGAAANLVAFTAALGPLIGALGVLPSLLAAVASGIGSVVLGFAGIGAAMKATGGAGSSVNNLAAAERRVEQAQKQALKAQEAINEARREAARRLADVTRELARARLDEEGAILAIEAAQRRLREARSSGDRLERAQADLAYRQAIQSLEDIRVQVADLEEEEAERTRKGVEGSDEVREAVERHEQALQNLRDAEEALKRAQSGGGGASKAAEAYAKLTREGKAVVDVLKKIAPEWRKVQQAVQSAQLAGVAGDIGLLSERYLPVMRRQLPDIAQGWNNAFRGMMQLASTDEFVRDVDNSLELQAVFWQRIGDSFAPFFSGFRHWVVVGSAFLPRMGRWVLDIATRFELWSLRARESGDAFRWIERAIVTGRDFSDLLASWARSIGLIFSHGFDPTFLSNLIAGSQAFERWLRTAEGQQRITRMFEEFRRVGSAVWRAIKQAIDVLSQLDLSGVITAFDLLNAVLKVANDNMGVLNTILPVLIPAYVLFKTNVLAVKVALGLKGAAAQVAGFYTERLGKVTEFASKMMHSAEFRAKALRAAYAGLATAGVAVALLALIEWRKSVRQTEMAIEDLIKDLNVLTESGQLTGELRDLFGDGAQGAQRFAESIELASRGLRKVNGNFHELRAAHGAGKIANDIYEAADSFYRLDQAVLEAVKSGADAQQILQGLKQAYGEQNIELAIQLGLLPNLAREAGLAAERNRALGLTAEGSAEQIRIQTQNLQLFRDTLRAQTDPIFAFIDAQNRAREAQKQLDDAIRQYGPNSEEAADATLELAEAQLNAASAATDLEKVSGQALLPVLKRMRDDGYLSEAAFEALATKITEAENAAKNIDGTRARVELDVYQRVFTKQFGSAPFGGASFSVLHEGGIVPGPRGQEVLGILQAGEEVKPLDAPPDEPAAGGPAEVVVRFEFAGAESDFKRFMRKIVRVGGRGNAQVAFGRA